MDRNVIIAIVLSILVLIGYQQLFPPSQSQQQKDTSTQKEKPQDITQTTPSQKEKPQEAPKTTSLQTVNIPAYLKDSKDTKDLDKEIVVENNLYQTIFSAKGAVIKNITLKKYTDKGGKQISFKGDNIIPPLGLGMDESFQLSNLIFKTKGSDIKLDNSLPSASLVFEFSSPELTITRTYTFTHDDYSINLKDEVKGLNSYWITLGRDFGIYERNDSAHFGPVILKDTDRLEFTAEGLNKDGSKNYKQGLKWIAQEDKYFFASIVPKTPIEDSKVWNSNGYALVALKMPAGANNYLIYAGPKEYETLKKYQAGLEHIVDFGIFSILAIPLLWVMNLFYGVFHNYGVAIILLTIITRIPFIPIISKGMSSMKKIQDIQPKINEIREKYKKDPKKMNQELMAIYKKHKVNPFGGCLPILLQIPVFFALYKILSLSIELRGAPFMLWITDLSEKDPYYILPIIMGVTMVIQQKMTPSTMDPKQQKLMMLLPVVFTFLFLTFPSGLVLYWLVNYILGIGQQLYINKKADKKTS